MILMSDKINELLKEMQGMTQEQVNSKFAEMREVMENRDKELDSKMGTMEAQKEKALADMQLKHETAMAELVEKIGSAFPSQPQTQAPLFKNSSEFFGLVRKGGDGDKRMKDLYEGSGAAGGYLVPTEYSNKIMQIALEKSIVRSRATVLNLKGPKFEMPYINPTSNVDGSQYGGATAYWTDEMETLTESQPNFGNVKLEPKKLTAYIEDSMELEDDSITNMGALLEGMYGGVIAFKEDYSFMAADGNAKPLGILNAPCLVTVSRATASQIHPLDIVTMISRFRGNLDDAVLLINQSTIPQVFLMKDDNGNFIWHPGMSGSISNKVMGTIYGVPYIITEKAQALGTEGDVILADWSHYLIGDRGGLKTDYSDHFLFKNHKRAYRCIKRVDGQPWLPSAITPHKGGSTLSPFVALS